MQKSKKKIVSVIYSLVNCVLRWARIDPNDSEVQKAMRRNMDWNIIAEEVAANRTQKRWDDFKRRILGGCRKKLIMLTIRILGSILNRSKVEKAIKLHR